MLNSYQRGWTGFITGTALLALLTSAAINSEGGQSPEASPTPYASIATRGTSYAGPGREAARDLAGATIRLGLLVPLRGPRQAEGEAIVAAARLALEDTSQNPLPAGRQLELAIGDESGPSWGHTSSELLRLVFDQQAVAVIASADGSTAHLSEQVGNRMGVPILTLSTDETVTQIDIPWIFRLGPGDSDQARIMAEDIYHTRHLRRVLLLAESNHDGRMGDREFRKAAHLFPDLTVNSLFVDTLLPNEDAVLTTIKREPPEAIVFWTRPESARLLMARICGDGIPTPIYLSMETAQKGSGFQFVLPDSGGEGINSGGGVWTIASSQTRNSLEEGFARRFEALTGSTPSPIAAEAYDAVRLIIRALRETGPNRARVRDQVAAVRNNLGASGPISFDQEGNNRPAVRLVRLAVDERSLAKEN